MFSYYSSLLREAATETLSLFGHTWGTIAVLVGTAMLSLVVTRYRHGGWGAIVKPPFVWSDIGVSLVVTIIVGFGLFAFNLARVTYQTHKTLTEKVQKYETSKTKSFDVGITQVAIGQYDKAEGVTLYEPNPNSGNVSVTVAISVVNRGQPAALIDWALFVRKKGTDEITAIQLFRPEDNWMIHLYMSEAGSPEVRFTGTEMIYKKTAPRVESGAWVSGFLIGRTASLTRQQFISSVYEVVVRCRDAFGESYEASRLFVPR
jgi:hypothetical protein